MKLEQQIQEASQNLRSIEQQLCDLHIAAKKARQRYAALQDEYLKEEYQAGLQTNKMPWGLLLKHDKNSDVQYDLMAQALKRHSPWIYASGLVLGTNQYGLKIRFNNESKKHLRAYREQILELLPFIIPRDTGNRWIEIQNPDVEEMGVSYEFSVNEDLITLYKRTLRRIPPMGIFNDWSLALEFMQDEFNMDHK